MSYGSGSCQLYPWSEGSAARSERVFEPRVLGSNGRFDVVLLDRWVSTPSDHSC
jgi:hypothetical protein